MKKEPTSIKLSSVDFCIHTEDNPTQLEALIASIAKHYPAAQIIIGDSSASVDRAYYKKLRADMAGAGLINRIVFHSLPYQSGMAKARNQLLSLSRSPYVVMLDQSQLVTKDTDILSMATAAASNKNIGIVSGAMANFETPKTGEKRPMKIGDHSFTEANYVSPFMVLKSEIGHYVRWNSEAENSHSDFCGRMKKAPYIMVFTDDITIGSQDNDAEKRNNSESGGDTTQRDVPTEPTNEEESTPEASDSVPSGEDEKTESVADSGTDGKSTTRPSRRKNK